MLAHGVAFFIFSIIEIARAGNTTCKSTSLDWFTESVGETPCRVYERLRQTCSPAYQVGNMGSSPPGDVCDDQVSTCCCNSVAFALSMLCMNCQYGIGSSVGNDHGFDAGAGAYGLYRGRCGAGTNQTLPNITQTAVCNQGINIPAYLYQLFWVPGDWYYEYTKGTAQLQIQSGKNETGLCPKTSASASGTATATVTAGSSTASASAAPDSGSSTNVGAIAGGAVGGVVLLALAVLVGFFLARRRKQRGIIDLTEENKSPVVPFEPYPATPHTAIPMAYTALSSSDHTSSSSSSAPTSHPPPRRQKAGQIASSPPTRAEIYDGQSHLSPPGTLTHSSDRHEDSDVLTSAYGLGRSASGRLPPSYEAR